MEKIKSVAFLVAHDAYLKGAKNIANHFPDDIEIMFYSTSEKLISNQRKTRIKYVSIKNGFSNSTISSADLLFAGLGGKELNILIHSVQKNSNKTKPKIVGYFPGVLHYRIFESLLTRILCDVVLLNCDRDFQIFRSLSASIHGQNTGILYGAPWITEKPASAKQDIDLLFVEQSVVPSGREQRSKLVRMLHELALRSPSENFVVKLRARTGQDSSHPLQYCLEKLYYTRHKSLPNLLFTTEDIDVLLQRSVCIATISSSVAYDSLFWDRKTVFINDFGLDANIGNDLFVQSGCMDKLENYNCDHRLNPEWASRYLQRPDHITLERIVDSPPLMIERGQGIVLKPMSMVVLIKLVFQFILTYRQSSWKQYWQLIRTIRNINRSIYLEK